MRGWSARRLQSVAGFGFWGLPSILSKQQQKQQQRYEHRSANNLLDRQEGNQKYITAAGFESAFCGPVAAPEGDILLECPCFIASGAHALRSRLQRSWSMFSPVGARVGTTASCVVLWRRTWGGAMRHFSPQSPRVRSAHSHSAITVASVAGASKNVFVKRADDLSARFAEVALLESDTVSRVGERAAAKLHWGVNAGHVDLFLVRRGGEDEPTSEEEAAALNGPRLGATLGHERAGIVDGVCLLAKVTGASAPTLGKTRLAKRLRRTFVARGDASALAALAGHRA